MCGIAGIYHSSRPEPVDRALLERMNACLVHRGPDDAGIYASGPVGMAMRRLSVIDLPTGHQPMSNATQDLWITFNGEIYNFQALREELIGKGRSFRTHSDTEVILQLYEEMGDACVTRLRGMFAFSLWDARRQRLLLARDRMGKKPLLYSMSAGRLCWASEMQALLAGPGISRDIDPDAVDLLLGLQYIPAPNSIFRSVRKLPPGHLLVCERGNIRLERYWDLSPESPELIVDVEEAKHEIRRRLKEATRLRMISDVPVGAFLSGGVDSTCVVALMSELSERPIKTFAVGFEEEEFSELPYARLTAARFGTDHTEFVVKPRMAEVLPELARHYGEPFGDSSALPTYYVARETRRLVAVALTGDGGDESFAGYGRYRAMKLMALLTRLPRPARLAFHRLASCWWPPASVSAHWREAWRYLVEAFPAEPFDRYLLFVEMLSERYKESLYEDGFKRARTAGSSTTSYLKPWFDRASSRDTVSQLLYLDLSTYLRECLMAKVDIATMIHSLEARSPFMDHEFIEYAFRLPAAWKLKRLYGSKWILKEAFKDVLPAAIQKRGKKGFSIPVDDWLRGELKDFWRDHVLSPAALRRGYFKPAALRRLFDDHVSGRAAHGARMWQLLMLELWHENFAPDARIG